MIPCHILKVSIIKLKPSQLSCINRATLYLMETFVKLVEEHLTSIKSWKFFPADNKTKLLSSMNWDPAFHRACVQFGQLYVWGWKAGKVSTFCEKPNLGEEKWKFVAGMNLSRSHLSVVSRWKLIWEFGGEDTNYKSLKSPVLMTMLLRGGLYQFQWFRREVFIRLLVFVITFSLLVVSIGMIGYWIVQKCFWHLYPTVYWVKHMI